MTQTTKTTKIFGISAPKLVKINYYLVCKGKKSLNLLTSVISKVKLEPKRVHSARPAAKPKIDVTSINDAEKKEAFAENS